MPTRGDGGYSDMPGAEMPNVSFLLTLLTTLDFTSPGSVLKEDWERGIAALYAPGLSWDVSWQMLLKRFDLDFNGSIDFGEMHGLAPLDPRLASLLRVIVQTLVRLSERINGAYAGINETKMKMLRGTINQWRDKCTAQVFKAWRDDVRETQRKRAAVLANFRYAPCRKCLHAMREMIADNKAKMSRAANMMRGKEVRLLQITMTAWSDSVFAEEHEKAERLREYFLDRNEFWKMHVVRTWRSWTRHERCIRRFLMRWMFQGMGKTFTGWKRYVRAAIEERNAGLARGMAMFNGGTR